MPAAYVIAQVDVHDPEAYEAYKAQVPATVAQFGGVFVARGGRSEALEGDAPPGRTVILKFPSYEAALAWHGSAEYAGPKALRQSLSTGKLMVVEAVD